ncbi:hypothetical protein RF11_11258 [Thelohanellus kitauei]|uniref:Uncharacterized protein n=1 Tax=Thelohanellus kitauei TaxID=669202 RepID=A0A0C2I7I9_THEKT|nr:hypothetical protein RF11_11258 [Thelohanellus kitauei]
MADDYQNFSKGSSNPNRCKQRLLSSRKKNRCPKLYAGLVRWLPNATKRQTHISWVGSETYQLLGKICPYFEKDCPYEEISKILTVYSKEARCSLKHVQSYKEWFPELRRIAKRCRQPLNPKFHWFAGGKDNQLKVEIMQAVLYHPFEA